LGQLDPGIHDFDFLVMDIESGASLLTRSHRVKPFQAPLAHDLLLLGAAVG